ncbi:chemotaxis protein CheA [Thiocystis minor]|uniref:chemotaxis protein CheA n=1 Tax=Thiocystis minor TaxID=61597 RepID=UPI001913501C|nr:chemotaxis protein CheA [Thiocystis minor]MBK5966349.1 chemotaxis protein CheA [Thiocystis minor]
MNPLLEQFLSEARDFLQGIGEKLMQLENAPDDAALMGELFRLVHTLKGNSGLFDFPEMTRVLHAGEDLMDAVRNGRVAYSRLLADCLLDAMDFVGMLCNEIEANGAMGVTHAGTSVRLVESLRQLMERDAAGPRHADTIETAEAETASGATEHPSASFRADLPLAVIPEAARMDAYRHAGAGHLLHWIAYTPSEQCFYQGEDPFFLARQTPELRWGCIEARDPWPPLAEMDAYCCLLDFCLLTAAPRAELEEHYRYVMDQVEIAPLPRLALVLPQGDSNGGPVYDDFATDARHLLATGDLVGLARNAGTMLELSNPDLWIASALRWLRLMLEIEPENRAALAVLVESLSRLAAPDWASIQIGTTGSAEHSEITRPSQPDDGQFVATASESRPMEPINQGQAMANGPASAEADALAAIVATQREILALTDDPAWLPGRIKAAAAALAGCLRVSVAPDALPGLETGLDAATTLALADNSGAALLAWLDGQFSPSLDLSDAEGAAADGSVNAEETTATMARESTTQAPLAPTPPPEGDGEIKFGRRAEDAIAGPKSLKVDQAKIDRLMNLIGEMVVAKNALPYLAGRAEAVFGVRELSRDIKGHYAVINRIAEEMQDAIMQVRMMPVSFVFQRFPRLVRDISRKLGKEVNLVLEGEETEADKNIIEALGDPLMHIVRNSLDHGIELPEVRRVAGKPAAGTLTLRAAQESDRVVIVIQDDGKGIDPDAIKRKAYAKGLIDEATLERIGDQEAVNLVFAAGFSTAEQVSDLSGRGVGMDVVRTAVDKVNGTLALTSERGRGTHLSLSLPLSMAVTNVMIVVSDGQRFGIPMDSVVETVRVPRAAIRTIKHSLATVLRGRIVPLKSINGLLGLDVAPKANADDELAVLVVRLGNEAVGLLVDDFRETLDIILKPMTGVLAGIPAYAGSALMGDGSVLMVLNVKEIL